MKGKEENNSYSTCVESDAPKTKFGAYVNLMQVYLLFIFVQLLMVIFSGGFFISILTDKVYYTDQIIIFIVSFIFTFVWPMACKEGLMSTIRCARSFGNKNPIGISSNCPEP